MFGAKIQQRCFYFHTLIAEYFILPLLTLLASVTFHKVFFFYTCGKISDKTVITSNLGENLCCEISHEDMYSLASLMTLTQGDTATCRRNKIQCICNNLFSLGRILPLYALEKAICLVEILAAIYPLWTSFFRSANN